MSVAQTASAAAYPNDLLSVLKYFRISCTCFLIFRDGSQRNFNDDVFTVFARTKRSASALTIFCDYVLVVAQMQEGPKLAVASEDDVTTAATVPAIGSGHSTEFGAKEVPASCTAMSALAEHTYIVDEVIFFQNRLSYATVDKDTWSIS